MLTRRGKPVAEIRSREGDSAQANTQQAIDDLRKFRHSNRVGSFDIADFVAEGRR